MWWVQLGDRGGVKGEMNILMVGATWGQRGGVKGAMNIFVVGATWRVGKMNILMVFLFGSVEKP